MVLYIHQGSSILRPWTSTQFTGRRLAPIHGPWTGPRHARKRSTQRRSSVGRMQEACGSMLLSGPRKNRSLWCPKDWGPLPYNRGPQLTGCGPAPGRGAPEAGLHQQAKLRMCMCGIQVACEITHGPGPRKNRPPRNRSLVPQKLRGGRALLYTACQWPTWTQCGIPGENLTILISIRDLINKSFRFLHQRACLHFFLRGGSSGKLVRLVCSF